MLWSNGNCANVAAEYAAALASNYVNFGNPDDLKYAKALYNFAKSSPGAYSCEFYASGKSGTADELAWAACWLAIATNKDATYMADVNNAPEGWWVMNWENVSLGASILKGELTGDWSGAHELDSLNGDGYKFYDKWGSARHNATAQMCSLVAAKHGKGNASWAKGQMEYLTGDKAFANGQKYCLVVGFKPDSSNKPHHRAASGTSTAESDGTPSAHVLVGALCGGPTDANGTYADKRSDYIANEVACDYNAGFVGAAAGLYSFYKTGSIETSIPGVTKIYSGGSTPDPITQTTTTSYNNPDIKTTTTTVKTPDPDIVTGKGDIVLLPDDMTMGTEEGSDGGVNNYAEFAPQGAKSATLYVKVNSNDTEIAGEFGTWNGDWVEDKFDKVKVGSDKIATVDYTIPDDVGSVVKAIVWWPHGNDVEIQKVVLHTGGSSSSATTTTSKTTTTTTTSRTTTTTTTTKTTTTTTTTQPQPHNLEVQIYGDADCSGKVKMNDAVLVMQALSNGDRFGESGNDPSHITAQGALNADCHQPGSKLTPNDAYAIQMKLLDKTSLPMY